MYHKCFVIGNLGQDPELRYTPSGTPVCNFGVAANETWTDGNGEKQERTTWYRANVWGKAAEACNQYLSKGRQVFIEGRINPDPETGGPRVFTKNDGSAGASYELTAQVVKFLGGRNGNEQGEYVVEGEAESEDIPF